MARARFAKAVSQSAGVPERASVRDSLWFDIEAAESPDDLSLSEAARPVVTVQRVSP